CLPWIEILVRRRTRPSIHRPRSRTGAHLPRRPVRTPGPGSAAPRGALTAGPEVGVDDGRVRFCREIGGPDRGLSTVGAPARGLAILAAEPRRVPTWAVPVIPPRAAHDQRA